MGGKSGGGGGSSGSNFGFSSGTSTYTPNAQAMAAYEQALGMANSAVSRPYQPYQGQMTAGFNPDQMSAFQGVRNLQGVSQPYINTATNLTQQAVDYSDPRNYNQYALQQYMNPYQKAVVDATMKNLTQQQAQAYQQAGSTAASQQGAFGGSGQFMGQAEVARQQGLANANVLAQLNASNYQQAQNQYNQQQQQAIQTAQQAAYGLGQLGSMAQATGLTGINALLQTGGQQQQLAQQQLTGAYNQFLQELAYPYQQAAFYSGIASGIGPSMGGTTTYSGINMGQSQQQQQGGGGGASGGLQMLGSLLPAMFSDEREKTDKKKLGKDPNTGLDLYAYRYKGDPKSYPKVVGPMAQDVEEKYPGFVFDVDGRKVVSDAERFMPRDSKAAGGTSSGSSSTGSSTGSSSFGSGLKSALSTGAADIYSAPSVDYGTPTAVPGSLQAQATAQMDPGTAAFIKGAFDPKTADQMARAKWVSPSIETRTAPENSFGYFSELARGAADGGRIEYARGGFGELPSQVNPSPLSAAGPIGQNFLNPKPSPGSLGDMISDTKLMFGANPIDSPMGSFEIAAIPSPGMAPSNLPKQASDLAQKMVPPKAASTEHFSAAGAKQAQAGAAEAAKSSGKGGGGGGHGGGGGGEGLTKAMKGMKSAIDKQAGGTERSAALTDSPKTETQSSEAQQEQSQPDAQSQSNAAQTEAQDSASDTGGFEGSVDSGDSAGGDFGGMDMAGPEAGGGMDMADAGGDMGGMGGGEDWLSGLGGMFAAHGGRVHKDGGGAAAGAPGSKGIATGMFGEAPATSNPNDVGDFGQPLGDFGLTLGERVLGTGPTPSLKAGFGNLKAGQEQRTGNDLVKGWMNEYRQDYKGGPQLTPEQQGMPKMPGPDWYKTPLNVSDLSIGSDGTPNPGGINYTPIATGMSGSAGLMMAPMFSPPTNGSDYNSTAKMFKAPPVSKVNGDQPVEGYFTSLASNQVNPDTGLFNVNYLAPYYGTFYKDGGRVGKASGGSRGMNYGPPQPYDLTPKDLKAIAATMHYEAQNQGNPGMGAVGHVIRNRFESGRYGATPYDVVTAQNKSGVAQFTPWGSKGAGSGKGIRNYQPTENEMNLAKQAFSESQDPTKGATHYYNPKLSNPNWGKTMDNPVQIGAHRFGTTSGGHGGGQPMMARLQDQGTQMAANAQPAATTPSTTAGPTTPTQWKPPAEIADKVNPTTPEPVVAQENFGSMTTPSSASSVQEAPGANEGPDIGGGNFDLGFNDQGPDMDTPDVDTAAYGGRIGMAAGGTSGGTLNIDQAVRLLMQNGATPTEAAYLAAIMMPESKGQTGIHSAPELKRDNSYGLWQINMLGGMGPERMRRYGLKSYNDLYDPNVNARAAIDLARNGRGLKNWSTYLHGDYRPYLNQARYYANKYAGDPEAVKAPIEIAPGRVPGFSPTHFAQASAPAHRPMGIIPRIIQEVVGVPSAHAEPAGYRFTGEGINPNDPSGPRGSAPIARGAAEGYMAHRAKVADRPTIFDVNPAAAGPRGEPTLTPEGKWAQYPDLIVEPNGQRGFSDLGIGGTDVDQPMTYTGNRAPGFQDLTMSPFYQNEPVAAQDQTAQQQQPAQPNRAPAKQAQAPQEENPIEGFFNEIGSGLNQLGTGIGQGIEELGTGINSIFGEDNPRETMKKATKGATPHPAAQSDEAEGELDFGRLLGFSSGGKVKKKKRYSK